VVVSQNAGKWAKKNLKAMKKSDRLCVVRGTQEGWEYKGRLYENLKTPLLKALDDCGWDYLIFIGHSDGSFLVQGGGKKYGLEFPLETLKGKKKLRLIGLDECLIGTGDYLSQLLEVAETAVGSSYLEPYWGWQGIYDRWRELRNFPGKWPEAYQMYNREKERELGNSVFLNSGIVCTDLLVKGKEESHAEECYYGGER
jgi:hypothetical protein